MVDSTLGRGRVLLEKVSGLEYGFTQDELK